MPFPGYMVALRVWPPGTDKEIWIAITEGKKRKWKTMVAEDHREMYKGETVSNKQEGGTELLSYSQ